MESKIVEILMYTLPSLISGIVALYFFKAYTKSDAGLQNLALLKEDKKLGKTLQLQAYERMSIFLERITPASLVFRIKAQNDDKYAYEMSLLHTIETEFEHNLAQQIYISDECWQIISSAKNTTIQIIRDAAKDILVTNAQELRENIIKRVIDKHAPSDTALAFIKTEVRDLL